MGTLQITVGDLHCSARWEAGGTPDGRGDPPHAADRVEADPLPLERRDRPGSRSGTSGPALDYENHTSHPAPGQLAIYPGGISECEIFFPYGACTTASKVGQLAANHFATVVPDDGLAGPAPRDRPALPVGGRPAIRIVRRSWRPSSSVQATDGMPNRDPKANDQGGPWLAV